LVQRAAVPMDTFTAILREKALFAPALEKKLPRLLTRDYKHPNFSARHHLKDMELFLKETSSYELTASSLEGMRQVLEQSIAQRLGYFRLFGHLRDGQPDSIGSPSPPQACGDSRGR
jgi:3-hydroxyisobutyrate dehydrogenase